MAWVSPRWNSAEPCTRGNTSTLQVMSRSSFGPRPSGRLPERTRSRTTRSSNCSYARSKASGQMAPSASGSGMISARAFAFKAIPASTRACFPGVCFTSRIAS